MPTLPLQPLRGTRILSLALNLPGPAALLRCARMGATCTKLEAPATPPHPSADPMALYSPQAYRDMHQGIAVLQAHLKTDEGQAALHAELAHTDVPVGACISEAVELAKRYSTDDSHTFVNGLLSRLATELRSEQ